MNPSLALSHFSRVLPERVGDYHQEEIGPITCHHDQPGEADRILEGWFHLGGHTADFRAGIDWFAAPEGDLEWNGGLVRHGHLVLLTRAGERTGEKRYWRAGVEHLLDYVRRVPPFDPTGQPYLAYKRSTWRPFEVACRVAEAWPVLLARALPAGVVTSAEWEEILDAVRVHAAFLRRYHWQTGNHAAMEVADLGLVALFFPELEEAATWFDYAVRFLDEMWPRLFHADGYSREMSGSYHWVAVRSFYHFYEVAARLGRAAEFPPRFRERLRLGVRAEFLQQKPDGSAPVTNDSNLTIRRREVLLRAARCLDLPEIPQALAAGATGPSSAVTSWFFPEARLGVMRGGWGPLDAYLSLDMGRWGDNHMNQDQLSVEVSAAGRHFLSNTGRWRYTTSDPTAPWMPLAKYAKTTAACNSVLANGYGQAFGDADGWMTSAPEGDFAEGRFAAGYGEEVPGVDENLLRERGLATRMAIRLPGVVHTRQVCFLRPRGWLVRDRLEGPGLHFLEQLWHGVDGVFQPRDPAGTLWSTAFPGTNLVLRALAAGELSARYYHGSEDPRAGWHCPYYDQIRPAPELRFRLDGPGPLVLTTLLWLTHSPDEPVPTLRQEGDELELHHSGGCWRWRTLWGRPWDLLARSGCI